MAVMVTWCLAAGGGAAAADYVVSHHGETILKTRVLWGLMNRESRTVLDLSMRLSVRQREDGLLNVTASALAGKQTEEENGSRKTLLFPAMYRGKEIARGTWNPARHAWEKLEVLVPEDEKGLLSADRVRGALRTLDPGRDRTDVEDPDEDGKRTVYRFDYTPDEPEVSPDGRVVRRANVTIEKDGETTASGHLEFTGQIDPDTGFVREGTEHLEMEFQVQGVRATATIKRTTRVVPAEDSQEESR